MRVRTLLVYKAPAQPVLTEFEKTTIRPEEHPHPEQLKKLQESYTKIPKAGVVLFVPF